jgi:CTD small phosphatase-like protein 2
MHRLYRQHTTPHEDFAIKDLYNLGRDLSKTIIIDNLAENFNYTTPLNGIWVESWYDDMDDKVLSLLIPFLKAIAIN